MDWLQGKPVEFLVIHSLTVSLARQNGWVGDECKHSTSATYLPAGCWVTPGMHSLAETLGHPYDDIFAGFGFQN